MKTVITTIIIILALAAMFYNAIDVFAMGNDARSNACRTFHTFSHQKEQDTRQEMDGLYCNETVTKQTVKNDTIETVTIVTDTVSDTVTETVTETVPETVTEEKQNNGNHYGNDKSDQNEKDVKNQFNGTDTREQFETVKNGE